MNNFTSVLSIILPIVSVLISIIALIVAIFNNNQEKKSVFQSIANILFDQKNAFLNGYAQYHDMDLKNAKYLISELASNYCNAFESACALYLNNGIHKRLFVSVFKDEIIAIAEKKGVSALVDYSEGSLPDCYKNINDVYNIIK